MIDDISTKLAVVGAGPGGYAAAFAAADLGIEAVLIDDGPAPGGACLHRGCIPSKTLLHAARLLREAKAASEWGIDFGDPRIDIDKLRAHKDEVVGKLALGVEGLAKQRGVRLVQGRARFADAHTLLVQVNGLDRHRIRFEHAIVATGSRPAAIPGLATTSPNVMDSTAALALEEIPRDLLVIGGGYIGLELATVYSVLGSRVTVVEATGGLLPGADRDLVRVLSGSLKAQLHAILLNTQVAELKEAGGRIVARFAGEGASGEQAFDRVLIAVGRRPNTERLGLENTPVQLTERGFIKVDEQRRTTAPHIFAIGDVAGEPMLAHKAAHEGRIAAEVIAGKRVAFAPRVIPAVVYTDPELAWCGLTEDRAKAEGRAVKVARFPWGASGRALTLGRTDGVTKLVIDPETEHILGVGIVGSGAGELIAEGALAVEMAAVADDVKLTIHPHPTLSETIMEAAELFCGQSTHIFRRGR